MKKQHVLFAWAAIAAALLLYVLNRESESEKAAEIEQSVDSASERQESDKEARPEAEIQAAEAQPAQSGTGPSEEPKLADPFAGITEEDALRLAPIPDERDVQTRLAAFDGPVRQVKWDQFARTGIEFGSKGSQVELYVLFGLEGYSYDYAEALAEQGYYEIKQDTHPDLMETLRDPANAKLAHSLQIALIDEDDRTRSSVVIPLTRQKPKDPLTKGD